MSFKKMKISEIRRADGCYIREKYNEEYLDGLRAAIKEGNEPPSPKVYPNGELAEGRHTVQAYEDEGYQEIIVEIIPMPKNLLDKVIVSTIGHTKTKLPLLPQDYIHTFKRLILEGYTPKEIATIYRQKKILGNGRLNNYLLEAQGLIWNQQAAPALEMLNQGKTLPEISQQLKIPISFLQDKAKQMAKPKREQKELMLFKGVMRKHVGRFDDGIAYHYEKLRSLRNSGKVNNEEYLEGLHYLQQKTQTVLNKIEAQIKRFEKEMQSWKKSSTNQ